jgi:hypothetical protein
VKLWVLLLIVVTLSLAIWLAVTNPTKEDYARFLGTVMDQALLHMSEAPSTRDRDILREVIRAHGREVIASMIMPGTKRGNFGFWSVFESRLFGVEVIVYGAGGKFYPRDEPEEVVKKLGRIVMTPGK